MGQFASSIFTRTPDEKTVVQDVYKKMDNDVLNSYQDLSVTNMDTKGIFGFMSKSSSGSLIADVKSSTDDLSITDRISSTLGDKFTKAKTYMSDLVDGKKSIGEVIKSTTNSVTGLLRDSASIIATVGGIENVIKNGNIKDIRGITNTLNALTNQTSAALSPNGTITGILTGVVGEAGAAGISGGFKQVADYVKSSTDISNKSQSIYQVASGSLPGAVSRGDLRGVASMVDYIGNGSVSMMNPGAVKQLSQNNTATYPKTDIGGSGGQFYQYKDAYQKIDPNWNKSTYSTAGTGQQYSDMSCLMNASDGTKDVFITGAKMSDQPDDKQYAFVPGFKKTSVSEQIANQLPYSPAATTTNIYNPDVDPRLYDTTIY